MLQTPESLFELALIIEIQTVLQPQLPELIFETYLPMMRFLILDVRLENWQSGIAYGERSITILPSKPPSVGKPDLNPAAAVAFDLFDAIRN